ncbi:MAG TPA: hypothetical protein VEH84_03215, partial [Alphaproteobacteria bacterium]|nr:hypothetical protein [Alphaproteobacteria bacterium]
PAPAQAPAATAAAPRGPTAADIQAAGQMAPADRQQMIQGMVAGLAARLEADPSDIEGWLRLARSYGVLGNQDGQVQALARAAQQAPDRPDVQAAYADALLARSSAGAPSEADRAALQALLARLPAGSPQAAAVKQRLGG